jgi:hypothetical protein
MSFFLYNQDGSQAIARPYLDGVPVEGIPGPSPPDDAFHAMRKYHQRDRWDALTNAPSSNFVYDFEVYRFHVRDDWQETLAHTEDGTVVSGSRDALADAFAIGCEIKVGVRGLYSDLAASAEDAVDHEVFVQTHSGYYYTRQGLFIAGTHPLVRVRPAIPLVYTSRGWDFGWLIVRTDGFVSRLLYNPYTLTPRRSESRLPIRWFVR